MSPREAAMAEERSRLGRGLASLIGDVGGEAAHVERPSRTARKVPIEFIKANPNNPRRVFSDAELDELSASIKQHGVIQPIVVRAVKGAADRFEIIAGERRWRASQRAGLHEVPIVTVEASDGAALEIAIIENVQREDLNALEEALGYQQLIDEFQYTQAALADVIGKSRPHVANLLGLLRLPDTVIGYLESGKLTAGHARALINVPDPEAVARKIAEEGLSVRDAEALRQKESPKTRKAKAPAEKDADTRAIEKALSDRLGLSVTIDHKPDGGSVRIAYKTLEQLDEVCRRLQV